MYISSKRVNPIIHSNQVYQARRKTIARKTKATTVFNRLLDHDSQEKHNIQSPSSAVADRFATKPGDTLNHPPPLSPLALALGKSIHVTMSFKRHLECLLKCFHGLKQILGPYLSLPIGSCRPSSMPMRTPARHTAVTARLSNDAHESAPCRTEAPIGSPTVRAWALSPTPSSSTITEISTPLLPVLARCNGWPRDHPVVPLALFENDHHLDSSTGRPGLGAQSAHNYPIMTHTCPRTF